MHVRVAESGKGARSSQSLENALESRAPRVVEYAREPNKIKKRDTRERRRRERRKLDAFT